MQTVDGTRFLAEAVSSLVEIERKSISRATKDLYYEIAAISAERTMSMYKLADKLYEYKREGDEEDMDTNHRALMQASEKFQIEWASIMFGLRCRLQDIVNSKFDTGIWEEVAVKLRATHIRGLREDSLLLDLTEDEVAAWPVAISWWREEIRTRTQEAAAAP